MQLSPEFIQHRLSKELPGVKSHLKLAPDEREADLKQMNGNYEHARKSAVMILMFHENRQMKVIFIRRSFYVGIHAGQIAFPGGRYEEFDHEILNTAYREIEEEVGIKRNAIELLGRLTDIYVPPSNFLVSIFVGYLPQKPKYIINKREVAEIIEVDIRDFFKDDVIDEKVFTVPSDRKAVKAPYYKIANVELWGASAMVMTELLDVIKK